MTLNISVLLNIFDLVLLELKFWCTTETCYCSDTKLLLQNAISC